MQQARSRPMFDAWRPRRDAGLRKAIPIVGPGRLIGVGRAVTALMAILALYYHERRQRRLSRDAVEAARIDERVRLGRDLHDGILQDLTAAGLKLKLAARAPPESIAARIDEVAAIITSQQGRVRQLVEDRRSQGREAVALGTVLAEHLRVVGRQWSCRTDLSIEPPDLAVRPPLAAELVNIVSEAMANAVRHGDATELRVCFERAATALTVTIIDNGTGARHEPIADLPRSIAARVDALGGVMSVSRTPGFGLRITLPSAGAG